MLKGFFKKIKEVAGDLSPFAGLAASAFGLGPLYSTLIGAGVPLIAGKGAGDALAGGVGGYFGGKTFGSRFGPNASYVSPLDILKNSKIMGVGGDLSQSTGARDLVFDRLKDSLVLDSFKKDNPLRYIPAAIGGTAALQGLGAFEEQPMPDLTTRDIEYDASKNPFLIKDKFFQAAKDADVIGNEPGDIYDFMKKFGLGFKEGNPTTQEVIESANRMSQLEGEEEYQAYLNRLILESIRKGKPLPDTVTSDRGGKGNFATGGGIGDLVEPNMLGGQIGGDRVNPTGGRLVGMGSGREDLLEGEIVDPNTGQTQEIMVSNNEHVIPEYSLFALGGGDTEKGQAMMDDLRAKTKPMAKQMGYDFQGAEDGSMNYAPVMAEDGTDTKGDGLMSVAKELSDYMRGSNRMLSEDDAMKQSALAVQRFGVDKVREMLSAARLREIEMNKQKGMISRSPGVDFFDRPTMGAKDGKGTGSLLMDFIGSEGMFAPSRKKFDTSDSPISTGQETGETIGEVAARPKKPNEVDRQKIYVEVMNYSKGKISDDEFLNKTGFVIPQIDGVRGGGNFDELFNTLMKDLDKRGYTGLAGTSLLPTMQDGKNTGMPGGVNLQEIIRKMMAQGKSIQEIMAIMSKLQSGMPKQKQMPMMTAQDGMGTEEVNGLKKMGMQNGSMTADPMMQRGLGNLISDMANAEQMNMMSR